MSRMGFSVLPDILWRKQTNAPNKFMGSGMLPPGAYVTYEHEYVLIFRKGANRVFRAPEEKENRNRSAFFWEERNVWFSDVWTDLKGTIQELASPEARGRSGAYPFELAYRLVNMFSVASDTVLDPFLGTGTTMAAAIASGRNSLGVELDAGLADSIRQTVQGAVAFGNERIARRLSAHRAFVEERAASGRPLKHQNRHYGFPVMTRQEMELVLLRPRACSETAEPSSPEPSSVEAAPVKPVGDLRFEVDYSSEEPSPSVTDLDRNFHCSPRSSVVQLKQGELEF